MSHVERRERDGRVSYLARWREASGRQRKRSFARMTDARRFLVSIDDAKLRGAYVDPSAGRVSLGKQAERWYGATAALKPSTRRDYRALLDHQVLPRFRDFPLSGIDTLAVREWVAGLIDAGLGVKRARKALGVLSLVLDSAVEGKLLAVNVAAGLKRLPVAQRREMLFLEAVQVERLAAAIDERWRVLVLLSAYTGLRPCEVVALKVKRLDLLRGAVRVAEAAPEVAGHLEWGDVKTHEARTVRLPRFLVDELGSYLDGRPTGPDDLVFTAARGGPLRESKWVPGYFKPAVRAAGLPATLRWYDLRHTCASLLIREGASIKAVQKAMGHKTASITLDTYGHLFPDELDRVAERLERLRARATAPPARPSRAPEVVQLRKGAGQ